MGYKPYKMDSKYRVSIPTAWRPDDESGLFLMMSKTHELPVIKVLTAQALKVREDIVNNSDFSPAKKSEKLNRLYMLCREASLNDQGKLLVPKDLSEQVGISAEADVILAGRGLHFEVWSKANHERVLEIEINQNDEDELGIF